MPEQFEKYHQLNDEIILMNQQLKKLYNINPQKYAPVIQQWDRITEGFNKKRLSAYMKVLNREKEKNVPTDNTEKSYLDIIGEKITPSTYVSKDFQFY